MAFNNPKVYSLNGTFTVDDLIALTLGSISAFACAELFLIKGGDSYEEKKLNC